MRISSPSPVLCKWAAVMNMATATLAEFLSKTPGELNGSSGLDILDVELLYQYLTTGSPTITSVMTEAQFLDNADVNRDTIIDVYDLQLLYEMVCNG